MFAVPHMMGREKGDTSLPLWDHLTLAPLVLLLLGQVADSIPTNRATEPHSLNILGAFSIPPSHLVKGTPLYPTCSFPQPLEPCEAAHTAAFL